MKSLYESILSSNGAGKAGLQDFDSIVRILTKILKDNFKQQGHPMYKMSTVVTGGKSYQYGLIEYSPKDKQDWDDRINKVVSMLKKIYDNHCSYSKDKISTHISINFKDNKHSSVFLKFNDEYKVYTIHTLEDILKEAF